MRGRGADYGVRGSVRQALALAPPRGLLYRDAHYFSATVEVDVPTMQSWLPAGVHAVTPGRADLFTAWFPHCTYGSVYHEAGLFVHIKTVGGRTGIHCPWMILDDDVALILGRELLGYPKKLGEIEWKLEAPFISATASRRGTDLISMSGRIGAVLEDAPPILGRPHRNVSGTLGLALPRIIGFTPGEHPIETRAVHLDDFRIGGTDRDPLDRMGLGSVVEARLHRVNLSAGIPPVPLRPLTPLFSLTRLRPRVL
ncbi:MULTISPECIES: acetoacetate decarboxylase family protein [Tsukamurella]|uniref:Acetoacetate decarboxylase n=2 Tax=Tsukamurella TaxID=2060 RepID=A0A5C5RYZ2_9ACTN|nr:MULTISPECIES: acetoacetate decarboxylase family protein [Tsukamurella]NMD54139.1 acetoacetate decarboxylase family protein [Tsukamurella columbiensis]TWS28327.1 acetoacetate decarboxylase [Tsukamurella conjunctivitidis]